MKKIILSIAFIASGLVASAQVGVGTQNPQTTLHVVGAGVTDNGPTGANTPVALTSVDGITVPVVTNDMTITVANGTPAGTKASQLVYSNFAGKTGFYYWNGVDAWVPFGGGSFVSKVLTRTNAYTNLVPADLSGNNVTTIFYSPSSTNIALTALTNTPADIGKIVQFYNGAANFEVNYTSPEGTARTHTVQSTRGVSFVWFGTGWAKSTF